MGLFGAWSSHEWSLAGHGATEGFEPLGAEVGFGVKHEVVPVLPKGISEACFRQPGFRRRDEPAPSLLSSSLEWFAGVLHLLFVDFPLFGCIFLGYQRTSSVKQTLLPSDLMVPPRVTAWQG